MKKSFFRRRNEGTCEQVTPKLFFSVSQLTEHFRNLADIVEMRSDFEIIDLLPEVFRGSRRSSEKTFFSDGRAGAALRLTVSSSGE